MTTRLSEESGEVVPRISTVSPTWIVSEDAVIVIDDVAKGVSK